MKMEDIKVIFYVLVYLYWLFSVMYLTGCWVNCIKEITPLKWLLMWSVSCTLGWFITPIVLAFHLSTQHTEN